MCLKVYYYQIVGENYLSFVERQTAKTFGKYTHDRSSSDPKTLKIQ